MMMEKIPTVSAYGRDGIERNERKKKFAHRE